MNKKIIIPLVLLILILAAGIAYLAINLKEQQETNKEMQELADLDKKEMENEYQRFAQQYSEMMTQINNDSIVEQLTQEQLKTQRLLEELKRVKSNDAREIARLKKELATVREVLRSYVLQIDSLNRLNQSLTEENTRMKGQYEQATKEIEGLTTEKESLSEKVAIAAQLDATAISLTTKKSNGKKAKKLKDCKSMEVAFTIAKNVTAPNGNKTLYVRIVTPSGTVLGQGGTFTYENKTLECSMKKTIEYNGEQQRVTTYLKTSEFLNAGSYSVSIFADGHMIGSASFSLK